MKRMRGFSLIEMVAALSVFSVGVLGGVQMTVNVITKTRAVAQADSALGALENEIETVRATPFAQLTARVDAPFLSDEHALESLPEAKARLSIIPVNDVDGLFEVTASVCWRGDAGREIAKSLTTRVAARGKTQ